MWCIIVGIYILNIFLVIFFVIKAVSSYIWYIDKFTYDNKFTKGWLINNYGGLLSEERFYKRKWMYAASCGVRINYLILMMPSLILLGVTITLWKIYGEKYNVLVNFGSFISFTNMIYMPTIYFLVINLYSNYKNEYFFIFIDVFLFSKFINKLISAFFDKLEIDPKAMIFSVGVGILLYLVIIFISIIIFVAYNSDLLY